MNDLSILLGFLPKLVPVIGVIVVLLIIFSGYCKAPPDQAYIISGLMKKSRVLIGKAGVKIPFLERLDKLTLTLIPIDVKTATEVPTADYINVRVDATVNVKIGKTDELLARAATNFLNLPARDIGAIAREVLEGNMREIVGQMKLEEMVSNRQKFTELVKANAEPDLLEMGLEIVSFNVQNFVDANGVIENLGVDNVVRIQKKAAISRAESERDISVSKSKAAEEANAAQAAAALKIAEQNADLETKKADLKKQVDTQKAQADAASMIEAEKQRQLLDVAATNADIAKAEREAELKQKEIELKEYELDALVRKQADADKYAAEKKAEAILIARQKEAEAKAYEVAKEAEALRIKAEADKYAALQQAEGIAAIGQAQAEAIEKKAKAQAKMEKASIVDMYLKAMPSIVASASGPLEKVQEIHMYGNDNTTQLTKEVMNNASQVMKAVGESTGIDLADLISNFVKGDK